MAQLRCKDHSAKSRCAMSGENIYFAWVTDKTGSDEVIFRSSNDAGGTFNDKITLSNTTYSSLQDVQVSAGADNVVVTWWQINSTSDEPVARISANNGQTFATLLNLPPTGPSPLLNKKENL